MSGAPVIPSLRALDSSEREVLFTTEEAKAAKKQQEDELNDLLTYDGKQYLGRTVQPEEEHWSENGEKRKTIYRFKKIILNVEDELDRRYIFFLIDYRYVNLFIFLTCALPH